MVTQPSRKEVTHERILQTAACAIRRAGFRGVGVADIMKEAGLTHGGFYAHFRSRDALLAEALDHCGRGSTERLARALAHPRSEGASALRVLVDTYLSESHLRATEGGCPVAALASEMPRQAPEVRKAAARRVHGLVALVRDALPAGAAPDTAVAIASQLVGALQLARALGNNAEGKALMAGVRRRVLEQYDVPASSLDR